MYNKGQWVYILEGEYVLVVDPGLKNILQIQIYRNGQLAKTVRLTQNGYYATSLLNLSMKRWKAWNNRSQMKELSHSHQIHHFKTADMQQIHESMDQYQGVQEGEQESIRDKIHVRALTPKKFERLRFFTYVKKQETIHRFLSNLVEYCGKQESIMYYGDGSFASSGKGQRSVPCKWVKRECKNYFTCYSVNEFRTSQICPTCNERLLDVRKHLRTGPRKTVMVRGLKYCSSDICRSNRYKNRDVVGCTNIYRKTRRVYPIIMNRSAPRWAHPADKHDLKWVGTPIHNIMSNYDLTNKYAHLLDLILWKVTIMRHSNENEIDDDIKRECRNDSLGMFSIVFPNVISFLLEEAKLPLLLCGRREYNLS